MHQIERAKGQTMTRISTIRPLARIAAAGVALSLIAASPAFSACEKTKRRINSLSLANAITIVTNATEDKTLTVSFFRNNTVKATKYLKPGETAQYNHGLNGSTAKATLSAQVSAEDLSKGAWCTYKVRNGDNNLIWNLADNETTACPDTNQMAIACAKKFDYGGSAYRTTFTVTMK